MGEDLQASEIRQESVVIVIGETKTIERDGAERSSSSKNYLNDILEELFLALGGKKGRVEIIAGAVGGELLGLYTEVLQAMKFEVDIVSLETQPNPETSANQIKRADVLFFVTSDPEVFIQSCKESGIVDTIKERFDKSEILVAAAEKAAVAIGRKGLELVRKVYINNAFTISDELVDLSTFISSEEDTVGIGLGENAALIIRGEREVEVFGSGLVTVIEKGEVEEEKNINSSLKNLIVQLLSKGDRHTF